MKDTKQMYDLSVITRDNLHFLLSAARDEIVKYTDCSKEVERCNKRIKEEIKEAYPKYGWEIFGLFMSTFLVSCLFLMLQSSNPYSLMDYIFIVILIIIISFAAINNIINKKSDRKIARKNIEKYKSQRFDLQEKEAAAINDFKAALLIPDEYCYEYALTTMLQFIDKKRADSWWKEVTALYEEHLHRATLEENAALRLELAKQQAEYARQTRNASRMTAAGAWASAAGIWRINSKL